MYLPVYNTLTIIQYSYNMMYWVFHTRIIRVLHSFFRIDIGFFLFLIIIHMYKGIILKENHKNVYVGNN